MIVLGLGNNLGAREVLLREGIQRLGQIPSLRIKQVSYLYESEAMLLPEALPEWNLPYLNCAVSVEYAGTPQSLLREVKCIEKEMGRGEHARWSPRPIDIDILFWDGVELNTPELTIPHLGLLKRPFALCPLADLYNEKPPIGLEVLQKWQATHNYPFSTRRLGYLYPQFVGIMNLTPDSFSDGASDLSEARVLAQLESLLEAGVRVVDVG